MVLFSAIALATILPAAVTLAFVLPEAMAIVNDIAIAMTVPMAMYIALADATRVVIVHQYKKSKHLFCCRFRYGYCFVHSSQLVYLPG